ncbi:MAG: hypothetical protein E7331_12155 [Clostridiales bacterium]|nr:hypothetical protein [Clostridiales bacterium]
MKKRILTAWILLLAALCNSCFFWNKKESTLSGEYVGKTHGEFLVLDFGEGKKKEVTVEMMGLSLKGKYKVEGDVVTVTVKNLPVDSDGQKREPIIMEGLIHGDEIAFDDATVKKGLDWREQEVYGMSDRDFYNHFQFRSRNRSQFERMVCGFYVLWMGSEAHLYSGCSNAENVILVPATVTRPGNRTQECRVVLQGPTDEGGLYDTFSESPVHTVIIADGVEVRDFFGYNNDQLKRICFPDDTEEVVCCTEEYSMMEAMLEIYPDVIYYVAEGSSAHQVCEKLNLPYRFRPDYAQAGLIITENLSENAPEVQAYIDLLD